MNTNKKSYSELLSKEMEYKNTLLPNQEFTSCEFTKDRDLFYDELFKFLVINSDLKSPKEELKLESHKDFPIATLGSNPIMLRLLITWIKLKQPKKILEIGTFVGVSSLYMAQNMPDDSSIITIEKFDEFAEIAKTNISNNNMDDKIDIIVGDALEVIQSFKQNEEFDFIFLDGDKGMYDEYFKLLDPMLKKGGIIIVDDILFHGDLLNDTQVTEKGEGINRFLNDIKDSTSNYHKMILPLSNGSLIMIKE